MYSVKLNKKLDRNFRDMNFIDFQIPIKRQYTY